MGESTGGGDAGLVRVAELLRGAAGDRAGALWRLTGEARQLDANIVRLPPGRDVADHVEPALDVLVAGLAGRGTLRRDGTAHELLPGTVLLLERGTVRGVRAADGGEGGDEGGLVYLTVHRRRPGLAIGTPPREAAADPAQGGEPACLLDRVCAGCGSVVEPRGAARCPRCGEPRSTGGA
ncbi:hypothetical protein [Streptomyces aidingensis]|nr:hypothetical protein [Streptomyces aidingensis]